MTTTEFNKKYKDYLEKGHYGLDIYVPTVIEYLDNLFPRLIEEYPDFKYTQIKTKFGMARCYLYPREIDTTSIENHIDNLLTLSK